MVMAMLEAPTALEELLELLEEAAGPAAAAGVIGVASMMVLSSSSGLGSGLGSGSTPSNFNGPQPGQPGGGMLPTANIPSAIEAQNVFQLLQTGAIGGISVAGIGSLVAVFDLPRTDDNFRATAGIFEEINVPRWRRKGIRRQIVNPISKITHRMAQSMTQIRRYISKIPYEYSKMGSFIHHINNLLCFLKLQICPKKTTLF